VSLSRAHELAAALGQWAASDDAAEPEAPATRRAMHTAAELVSVLMDADRAAEERVLRLSYPFARTRGHCLHGLGCPATRASAAYWPMTTCEAQAYLRETHERRRCTVCQPDIPEPMWVRVVSAGGQVRWRLADDVDPGEVL
jgi:hypothetical protein